MTNEVSSYDQEVVSSKASGSQVQECEFDFDSLKKLLEQHGVKDDEKIKEVSEIIKLIEKNIEKDPENIDPKIKEKFKDLQPDQISHLMKMIESRKAEISDAKNGQLQSSENSSANSLMIGGGLTLGSVAVASFPPLGIAVFAVVALSIAKQNAPNVFKSITNYLTGEKPDYEVDKVSNYFDNLREALKSEIEQSSSQNNSQASSRNSDVAKSLPSDDQKQVEDIIKQLAGQKSAPNQGAKENLVTIFSR